MRIIWTELVGNEEEKMRTKKNTQNKKMTTETSRTDTKEGGLGKISLTGHTGRKKDMGETASNIPDEVVWIDSWTRDGNLGTAQKEKHFGEQWLPKPRMGETRRKRKFIY